MTFSRTLWARLTSGLLGAALLASACAPAPATTAPTAAPAKPAQPQSTTAPAKPAASTEKRGGELRFMLIQDAQTYDPAKTTESTAFTINSVVYDTLAELQPDGEIVPSLAQSWDITPDGLTYTFKLQKGVKFHNGREMTATDVKYSLDRIMDPATRSPRGLQYGSVASIDAPDPGTVVIKLKEPFAPLLATLADISAAVVPKEAVDAAGGDLSKGPVGTGPFRWTDWVRDQSVKVEAFKDHWRTGLPKLDRITFSFNNDANARGAAVRSGNVDFLWDAPAALLETFKNDASLEVFGANLQQQNWAYLLLNTQKDLFTDVRVRQAIYQALDRETIAQVSSPGLAGVLNAGFLPPTHWAGVKDVIYKPDQAKAKQLLTDAGKAGGFKFTISALAGSDFQVRSAQTIQQQIKPLGIEAEIRLLDASGLLGAARNGEFEGLVLGFSGTIDPDERFQQTFIAGGGTNYAKFSDAKVEELVKEARRALTRDERAKLYREAQLRLAEVGPFAYLYNYNKMDVLQKYVKGYVFNPQLIAYRGLRDVWLDK
jgi:peptide/nickel transport system substrate-binding protein